MKTIIMINLLWIAILIINNVMWYRNSMRDTNNFLDLIRKCDDAWSQRYSEINDSWSELLKKFNDNFSNSMLEILEKVVKLEERIDKYEENKI